MINLSQRQETILDSIIKEHIETAKPVGSKAVSRKYQSEVSSATVRLEMKFLADERLIEQPHISGGRVPTEKGYRYFVNKLLEKDALSEKEEFYLNRARKEKEYLKELAETIAQLTQGLAFCFSDDLQFFFTSGFRAFFSQENYFLIDQSSCLFDFLDRIDEYMEDCWQITEKEPLKIFIGKETPIKELRYCSTVIGRFPDKKSKKGVSLAVLISPMRTRYQKNLAVFEYLINN